MVAGQVVPEEKEVKAPKLKAVTETALETTIREGDNTTPDLGGTGTTDTFADALIRRL